MSTVSTLRLVKIIHTIIWAFFAGCILLIPVLAWRNQYRAALAISGIVFIEVAVLLLNRMRCPLTDVARRYSNDSSDNFDIYLPLWLARYNKAVFGTLFVAGLLLTLVKWSMTR